MNIDERNEMILMQNEEFEWCMRELAQERVNHKNTKNELTTLENKIYNKAKKIN